MNNLQSLFEIYQNRLFRIPDYQRGYAWKKEQLVDFWDDMMNLQEDRYHYTGLLSLKEVKPSPHSSDWNDEQWLMKAGYKAYYIVDGQQRLTTFSILIHEIVSFVKKMDGNQKCEEESIVLCHQSLDEIRAKYISRKRPPQKLITTYLFGYEIDNPSSEYLIHKIFEDHPERTINQTYYTQNLQYAKEFFSSCLGDVYQNEGIQGIASVFHKATLKLMFNIHEIEDDYDVFVAFETMNNRGKKLTNLELLKNRLIYLTTLYATPQLDEQDKRRLRGNINNAWKEVYYQLGRNKNNPLSDDDFLRSHWIMYFHYTRKKGDDYIKFLLEKFSPKNIFEKRVEAIEEPSEEPSDLDVEEDDDVSSPVENEVQESPVKSKLEPPEIQNYVSSLKSVAAYWFYTFFPQESSDLTEEEGVWLERLNRIGIGYFRPLIAVSLTRSVNSTVDDRIVLFRAIERFIFVLFRMAGFQSSYKSSDIYRKTRQVYNSELTVSEVASTLNELVDGDMEFAISNFMTRMDKRFSSATGFYGWRDLRYFLYEYEFEKGRETGVEKLQWKPFTRTEKDKVSIEHILPQTPSRWYWRNQFRKFSDEEVVTLSNSLGNLLPLSQSVNSSLQNDTFEEKKSGKSNGRRGYSDGSHSEIEVSRESDWEAQSILNRGLRLLHFLERRWEIRFKDQAQMIELLHIPFMTDARADVPEIPETIFDAPIDISIDAPIDISIDEGTSLSDLSQKRLHFWTQFVKYYRSKGYRNEIAGREPKPQGNYNIPVGTSLYFFFLQIQRDDKLIVGLYVNNRETFSILENKKDMIENVFGHKPEWYTSPPESQAKRIVYSVKAAVFDIQLYESHFDWLIEHYERFKKAIDSASQCLDA